MPDKSLSTGNKSVGAVSVYTIVAFLLTLAMCLLLVSVLVFNRSSVEKLKMEQLILEKSALINDVVSKLLYKTQVLSSIARQSNGEIENFEQIASTIVDDPSIMNILIAPNGVVSCVYPLEGNEAVLGLNFFAEGAGNKEAIMAKESGQLVLGGPFNAVQGGQVLVGRAPVVKDGPDGTESFWGLVSVTLKFPDALDGAGLKELGIEGFAYELWRINPDTNEKQVISSSGHSYNTYTNFVEKQVSVLNADWYLRILPVRVWYEFPETWASIALCICLSILVAAVVQSNYRLKELKNSIEVLSNTDSLTGINNRRYFTEAAKKQIDRNNRINSLSFIIMFDLDDFKCVNDKYGHLAGDLMLKEISSNVAGMLRSYDIFARYGGEEFILMITDIDKESAIGLAERIRERIAETRIEVSGNIVSVTSSAGVAPLTPENDLEKAVRLADEALYKAKEGGRDRVEFCE